MRASLRRQALPRRRWQAEGDGNGGCYPRREFTRRVYKKGLKKSRCAVTKVRPISASPRLATGPRYNVGQPTAPLVENRISDFRIGKFKILKAKRVMESEIAFGVDLPSKNDFGPNPNESEQNPKSHLA